MDAKALGIDPRRRYFIGKEVWKFERSLRYDEYYLNCTNSAIVKKYWHAKYWHWSAKLGFVIPPNVFRGKNKPLREYCCEF